MPAFEYRALDAKGNSKRGVIEADSSRLARQALREKQLFPVEINASRDKRRGGGSGFSLSRPKVNIADLALFTRHLATLIQSGIPVEEALAATAKHTRKAYLKGIVLELRSRVLEGHSLADGLNDHPNVFNSVYRALVSSGEKSGDLAEVLNQLAEYTEDSQKLRGVIVQAALYPLVLCFVALGVITALMTYVVPKVTAQFDHYDQVLPLLTRILIAISDGMASYWYTVVIAVIAVVLGAQWWLRDPERKLRAHRLQLRLPMWGPLVRELDSARMLRTLAILLSSGVPFLETLKVACATLSNEHLKQSMDRVREEVREGKSFSRCLQDEAELPPMAVYMIASGESSGELEQMVQRAAANLERELQARVQMFISLFEPLLIVVLGLVVLSIVLAILLPILQLNNLTQF
ncbi:MULTISPECIES: type II secretion system inner membrane protein GspF [Spongiibacter]|uniref:type II secretion system inner membrane protein GspF n=1 Tax=Spongiibacter TaxID=630749 RepID=UPI0003B779C8|nr:MULTISPECIES: type II secretion system inner membrane protein GspF [Spongiibacter]MBO6752512.1 type II secretion system inner membrane protein GspF [Spongiibacter sp.]MBU73418.1 type II secretion system protein GspF [Spongiibacter sp.]|tara:strand:+ start:5672 stop:6892 length:1221 start_codon:yes stop_codon:yes gene_type:complete